VISVFSVFSKPIEIYRTFCLSFNTERTKDSEVLFSVISVFSVFIKSIEILRTNRFSFNTERTEGTKYLFSVISVSSVFNPSFIAIPLTIRFIFLTQSAQRAQSFFLCSLCPLCLALLSFPNHISDNYNNTYNHHQGVITHQTRLDMAENRSEPVKHFRQSIHQPIDDLDVEEAP